MAIEWQKFAIPKPEPRKKTKARADRVQGDRVQRIHDYVFARERNICRICRFRAAESMHELRPRSLRGKVSRQNSVAVCGDGVRGCHGFAQRNEIRYRFETDGLGAEGTIIFIPVTPAAGEHLRLSKRDWIESPVMVETEIASL